MIQSKADLLRLLVGLRQVNDLDLIEDPSVLALIDGDSLRSIARRLAVVIDHIHTDFRYERSPEFLAKVEGKSDQVREMHVRILKSKSQDKMGQRLASSLVAILDSDEAYRLVAAENHHLLDELKELALSIQAK